MDTQTTSETRYVVFVVEDEEAWEAKSAGERDEAYRADERFRAALERRGGKIVVGAELAPSRTWHVLEHRGGLTRRTEGPYAESVEQLGGFYVVDTPDLEALLDACDEMAAAHVRLEVASTPAG